MDEQPKNNKSLLAAGAAALTVVVALILVFVLSSRDSGREQIVLPDSPAVEAPVEEPVIEDGFAEVTPDNVQNIVARLTRPASYHQTLAITHSANGMDRQQAVDLWRSGNRMLVQVSDETVTRSCLTDGRTLYLWYSDQEDIQELKLDEEVSYDDLVGIPTYETVANIPVRQISEASYLTATQPGEPQCIYLVCTQNGLRQEYRISLDSGLLYSQSAYDGDDPVYVLQQTRLEVLMDEDEALSDVFSLPDGSQPFAD